MNFQLVSDVHIEFHRDGGIEWATLLPVMSDTLVIAGDFGTSKGWECALEILARRYKHVVIVLGNHDYWYTSISTRNKQMKDFCVHHANVSWLNNSTVTIEGVRFVGTTLWFVKPHQLMSSASGINDLRYIKQSDEIYVENARAQDFLRTHVVHDDVVVTHYLPSWQSVAPRFAGSPWNCLFVCDMEDLITIAQPNMWVHGHTHDSCDYTIGQTRVVCNPHGYVSRELNLRFDESLVINV